jgi:hypothetical protein
MSNLQVSKNLTLAGVGLVAIADDTPCSQVSHYNIIDTYRPDESKIYLVRGEGW